MDNRLCPYNTSTFNIILLLSFPVCSQWHYIIVLRPPINSSKQCPPNCKVVHRVKMSKCTQCHIDISLSVMFFLIIIIIFFFHKEICLFWIMWNNHHTSPCCYYGNINIPHLQAAIGGSKHQGRSSVSWNDIGHPITGHTVVMNKQSKLK